MIVLLSLVFSCLCVQGDIRYHCSECPAHFVSRSGLREHLWRVHRTTAAGQMTEKQYRRKRETVRENQRRLYHERGTRHWKSKFPERSARSARAQLSPVQGQPARQHQTMGSDAAGSRSRSPARSTRAILSPLRVQPPRAVREHQATGIPVPPANITSQEPRASCPATSTVSELSVFEGFKSPSDILHSPPNQAIMQLLTHTVKPSSPPPPLQVAPKKPTSTTATIEDWDLDELIRVSLRRPYIAATELWQRTFHQESSTAARADAFNLAVRVCRDS